MDVRGALVGRDAELAQPVRARSSAQRQGAGGLLLLSGEAGVGKTRLAEAAATASSALVLRGAASNSAAAPYGPVIAVLRAYLRCASPTASTAAGRCAPHLALLLPELGEPAAASDRATIFEAVRCAFAQLAGEGHALVVLDDLQWSDEATLELLAALAPMLTEMPLVVIARVPLRRAAARPPAALAAQRAAPRRRPRRADAGAARSRRDRRAARAPAAQRARRPSLVRALHDRTQGVPFFVEELVDALVTSGGVRTGPARPRARWRRRASRSRHGPRRGADERRAAVRRRRAPRPRLPPSPARPSTCSSSVSSRAEAGVAELIRHGLMRDDGSGRARLPPRAELGGAVRRRALAAPARAAPPGRRAARGGRRPEHGDRHAVAGRARRGAGARRCSSARRAESEAVHAYRDADERGARRRSSCGPGRTTRPATGSSCSSATRAAPSGRASCAEAAKAWRELSAVRSAARREPRLRRRAAQARRRLRAEGRPRAGVRGAAAGGAGVRGQRSARRRGDRTPRDGEPPARSAPRYSDAIELAETAARGGDARPAPRPARPRARARGRRPARSAASSRRASRLVRTGLALALEHDLTTVAAELYQRLGMVLYNSADYRRAEEALDAALELCRADAAGDTEVACVTCLVYVLRECGDWRGRSRSAAS